MNLVVKLLAMTTLLQLTERLMRKTRIFPLLRKRIREKMSGGLSSLAITEDDITKMLAATTHIGSDNSETTMEQYVFKKKNDGINIINLKKTWEKILLAARAIAAVENPADVFVCASRPYTQRAVLKFARYVNCSPVAGRFTPGAFTNQIQAAFREPRLLVISDPRSDHQPITEGSYANVPVIAFCNIDSPIQVHRHRHPLQQQEPPQHRSDVVDVGPRGSQTARIDRSWLSVGGDARPVLLPRPRGGREGGEGEGRDRRGSDDEDRGLQRSSRQGGLGWRGRSPGLVC